MAVARVQAHLASCALALNSQDTETVTRPTKEFLAVAQTVAEVWIAPLQLSEEHQQVLYTCVRQEFNIMCHRALSGRAWQPWLASIATMMSIINLLRLPVGQRDVLVEHGLVIVPTLIQAHTNKLEAIMVKLELVFLGGGDDDKTIALPLDTPAMPDLL